MMAQIFPEWTNRIPTLGALAGLLVVVVGIAGVWYYGSPEYTDVGYRPKQPVEYSHRLHAGELGIDCRYCHTSVESSARANVPPTRTCMNCHTMVKADSEKLALVRQSFQTGRPIEWVRVHDLPEYAYFDHSIHISNGVSCISCHGNVAQMEEVTLSKSLSMGFCLSCHRDPGPELRPLEEVTNMAWEKPDNHEELVATWIRERDLNPPEACSGCHR